MSQVLLDKHPQIANGWILDRIPGKKGLALLLHPTLPRWILANDAGVEIAGLLDGTRSAEQIVRILASKWPDMDQMELLSDVTVFIDQLKHGGLLESAGESQVTAHAQKPASSMTIYLTEQCNLRCSHCAIVEGQMPETKLDAAAIRSLICGHTEKHPNARITFLGGEPLLHPDCLDLLEFAATKTSKLSMSTNGLLITPEVARRLACLDMEVQISLDGFDSVSHDAIRGKGTFEKAWRGIMEMVNVGAASRLTIGTTLTRSVARHVERHVAMLDQLGIGTIRFMPLNKTRAAATNWDQIHPTAEELADAVWWLTFQAPLRENAVAMVKGGFPGYTPDPPANRHWCPLGETFIIDSQGEAHVCPSLVTPQVKAGNVLDKGIGSIEAGEAPKRAREWMLGRRHRVEECRRCAWRNYCQGGCLAFMGHLTGSFDKNDEFCELRRNMYRKHALEKARINWNPEMPLGKRNENLTTLTMGKN